MKILNLDYLKFTTCEIQSLIEILNSYKRKDNYIDNEIIIDITLGVLFGSLRCVFRDENIKSNKITRTMLFVYFIEIIKHTIKRKRLKEVCINYDPSVKIVRIILR